MRTLVLFIAAAVIAGTALAGTVYKSVGPDGKVVYSDQPPPSGSKVEKTLDFANLPTTPLPDSVLRYREDLQKSMQKRLADPGNEPAASETVLFSAVWCRYCRDAKAYLAEKGIRYREYDVDTPDGRQALTAAGAGKGIPLLVRNGRKIQGYSRQAYDALFQADR